MEDERFSYKSSEYWDEYWVKKVERVVQISKEFGFDSYDTEFWERQTAGVISLIIDIYSELKYKK